MLLFESSSSSSPTVCRVCDVSETGTAALQNFSLKLCSVCHLVPYCSKKCQAKHWKEHKPHCSMIQKAIMVMDSMGQQERMRLGTSDGTDRVNAEAERLAAEARAHKCARRFDLAISLYTQALALDPYQHSYFQHRAETWMMAVETFHRAKPFSGMYLHMGIGDAQKTLDLNQRSAGAWLTMVRCSIQLRELDNARKYLEVALHLVPKESEDDKYARQSLEGYQRQLDEMQMNPSSMGPPQTILMHDAPDDLFYLHSNGMHNHARAPEFVMIDLSLKKCTHTRAEHMMEWMCGEALGGTLGLELGDVYGVACKDDNGGDSSDIMIDWVMPIPVKEERLREKIIALAGAIQFSSNIVVLSVVFHEDTGGEKPNPISDKRAAEMLEAIAENALNVPALYRYGKLLAENHNNF